MQRSRTEYVIDSRRLTQTITSKLVVVPAGGEENRQLILKESSIARQAISLQYLECRGSIQYQYDSANISTMKLYCVLAVSFVASFGNAFSPGILRSHRSTENARNTASSVHQFLVVDPSMLPLDVAFDAGIAALSAAAGALSQAPKIQQLERELATTRASLTESEQQLVAQIHELEEKLFVMDREFEGQTDKFKKQYDTKMREELERVTEKMKINFRYKLDIRVEEQKSKMLQDKLLDISGFTGDRQAELVDLRLQRSRIEIANETLEKALEASSVELKRLTDASSKKTGWWPF
jgi:hypothetical protein